MRAHWLQHVPFEGLGSIEPWLRRAGCDVTVTRFHESPDLPDAADVDALVVMGGPMSVNDGERYPWLAAEKRFIRGTIEAGVPVLGVCLGAQLIAGALGARVYKSPRREIGWFPVRGVFPAGGPAFSFPKEIEVFHWHGETFDLPPGAVRLAESDGCANQAFQIGRSVVGLQFHLEATAGAVRSLVESCRSELIPARYVQPEKDILAAPPGRYRRINRLMEEILIHLLG
jgi:GMP synthase-like glutamine amidotransferase